MHRQILDNPLLDLLQTIVVGIKDGLGTAKVLFHAGFRAPRDRQHPVKIVAHNRGLSRHRRHRAQLLQLALDLFACLFGQLGLFDLLFKLGNFVGAFFAIAQFLLDRLHLLVEVILALRPLHLGFDAGFDLFLDLQHGHFALHVAIDLLKALGHGQRF